MAKAKATQRRPHTRSQSVSSQTAARSEDTGRLAAADQAAHSHIRKSKSGLEWPRKLFHSSTGFLVLFLWSIHAPIPIVTKSLAVLLAVMIVFEVARFSSRRLEVLYEKYFGFLMRTSEKRQINGVVYYIIGVLTCLAFFPRDIAVISIVILSWCDTIASIFGRLFGRYTPPLPFRGTLFADRKSLAGSLAAVIAGGLAGYLFFTRLAAKGGEHDLSWKGATSLRHVWLGLPSEPATRFGRLPNPESNAPAWLVGVITGLAAGLAEAIEIWHLDDNLTMAPLAATLIWVAFKLT